MPVAAVLSTVALCCIGLARSAGADEPSREPSFLHGLGQATIGTIVEVPKVIFDATLSSPPVVGTLIGIIAAPVKAAQVMYRGLQEMAIAFDPWGIKRDAKNRGTLY